MTFGMASFQPIWPVKLLIPATPRVSLQSQSRSGGQSVTGVEQVIRSPAQRWAITLADIPVRSSAQVLAWRMLEAALDGRAGTILVPIYDWSRAPAGRSELVPFGDGADFGDGSAFVSFSTIIVLQQDAALNATALAVTWAGAAPQPGQHFSIEGELHRVVGLDQSGDAAGTLTVRPWMRAAWSAGTRLEFDEPTCLCRLAADDTMKLDLEVWRYASPSVDFVEAF